MSQTQAKRRESRAIFAVAAICALVFGLVVSGAAQASRASAGHLLSAHGPAASSVTCDHPDYAVDAAHHHSGPGEKSPGHTKCPDCCLAAHAGPAVLPERVGTPTRPALERAAPIAYVALSAREPESSHSSAVNGARAPPAHVQNS